MKHLLVILILVISAQVQALEIEPLMALAMGPNNIKIRVYSGGCTTKDSFYVHKIYDQRYSRVQIIFYRLNRDTCEAYIPEGKVLTYSHSELGINRDHSIFIGNPFSR